MRDFAIWSAVAVAVVASAPVAAAARSAEELNALASLRYQAAQTEVVAGRLSDAKIVALRNQVAQSEAALNTARSKLKAAQAAARQDKAAIAELGKTIDGLLGTLAAEKTAFTDELARRDAQYASDLAALQLAGEQLLATPEGLRALELYNAGGPGAFEAADRVLGEIEAARAKAREDAALVQQAEDRRARARLALDARGRGLTTTTIATERWEAVVAVGKPVVRDWTNLVDLYLAAGLVTRAREAADQTLALAKSDDDRAIALSRVADVMIEADDDDGALEVRREQLAINRKGSAIEPHSPERLRLVSMALREVGSLQRAAGDLAGARAATEEALRIDEQRLILAPTLDVRREISVDISALAEIDSAAGDHPAAIAKRKDVLARDRDILAADPQLVMSQRNLAMSLLSLAWEEIAFGRYQDAKALLPEAAAIIDALIASDPASTTYLDDKRYVLSTYETVMRAISEHAAAKAYSAEVLSIARKIVAIDPAAPGPKWRLSAALVDWASHLSFETKFEEKLALHEQALAIVQPLLDANPSPGAQETVADRISDVGWLNELVGRYALTQSAYEQSLKLLLLAERNNRALYLQTEIADLYGLMSGLAVKMGDKPTAIRHGKAAVEIRRKIIAINPERGGQTGLAESLSQLGTAYQANGQFEQALAARREEITIWRKLLDTSQSPANDKYRLSLALVSAARTAEIANDVTFTQAAYREGLQLIRQGASTDPIVYRGQLEYSLDSYANAPGTPPELKLGLIAERVGLLRGMDDPTALAAALFSLASARRDAGQTSASLADFAEGLAIIDTVIADQSSRAPARRIAAHAAVDAARITGALDDWRRALAAIEGWRAADPAFEGGAAMLAEVRSQLPADPQPADPPSQGSDT